MISLITEKNWQKYKGQKAFPEGSKPPPVWKCRTCFQNHWASDCPFANSDLKRTTGKLHLEIEIFFKISSIFI